MALLPKIVVVEPACASAAWSRQTALSLKFSPTLGSRKAWTPDQLESKILGPRLDPGRSALPPCRQVISIWLGPAKDRSLVGELGRRP